MLCFLEIHRTYCYMLKALISPVIEESILLYLIQGFTECLSTSEDICEQL